MAHSRLGDIAQLVERCVRNAEVRGSSPLISTTASEQGSLCSEGSGCMLTALTGACCGAAPEDSFTAACAAVAAMGVCGELAERRRLERRAGNASFRIYLIDAVFNLTEEEFKEAVRCEIL